MNQLRREKIGKYIQEKGAVTVKELSALFPDVSLMTIHRDLEKLEQEGVINRTRGGAVSAVQGSSITEAKLEARMHTNMKAKREMAAKALKLIEQGSAVFLDAGTSSMALAQAMPDMDVNIFTTGPNIALELGRLSDPDDSYVRRHPEPVQPGGVRAEHAADAGADQYCHGVSGSIRLYG